MLVYKDRNPLGVSCVTVKMALEGLMLGDGPLGIAVVNCPDRLNLNRCARTHVSCGQDLGCVSGESKRNTSLYTFAVLFCYCGYNVTGSLKALLWFPLCHGGL